MNDHDVIRDYAVATTERDSQLRDYVTEKLIGMSVPEELGHIIEIVGERSSLLRQLVTLATLRSEEDIDGHIDRISEIDTELKSYVVREFTLNLR